MLFEVKDKIFADILNFETKTTKCDFSLLKFEMLGSISRDICKSELSSVSTNFLILVRSSSKTWNEILLNTQMHI